MTNYESKKLRRDELRKNAELRKFVEDTKQHIMTTRFNHATWSENVAFRKGHSKFGCIYGTPEQNNSKFNDDSILFVLEMNNETNKIMGIGMIKNITHVKKYRIYNDDNYNRYAYIGKYRIDRVEVGEEDEFIFRVFDELCFNGSRHQKRLRGIKSFPIDMLFKVKKYKNIDLVDYIKNMFKQKIINATKTVERQESHETQENTEPAKK